MTVQRVSGESYALSWDASSSTLRVSSIYGSVATTAVDVWRLLYVPAYRRLISYTNFLAACSWSAADANLVAIGNGAVSGSQLDIRALSAPAAIRSDK